MKLTEDDRIVLQILVDEIQGKEPDYSKANLERAKEIVKNFQQILDDYEKARQYDNLRVNIRALQKENSQLKQNQKLRELVEKWLDAETEPWIINYLQKLLEESKE